MSKLPVFITGNQHKADNMARYLGFPIAHQKIELDEIQSIHLRDVVEHKVRQAYDIVRKPVIVDDVSLEFHALGGTFQTAVAKDTTYLVAGGKVGASKLNKAESYGTKIIDERKLMELLDEK